MLILNPKNLTRISRNRKFINLFVDKKIRKTILKLNFSEISFQDQFDFLYLIYEKKIVTFAELEIVFPEYFNGNMLIKLRGYSNLVLWDNLQLSIVNFINTCVKFNIFKFYYCHPLFYLIRGSGLTLPIAQEEKDHNEPHWFPVVFHSNS